MYNQLDYCLLECERMKGKFIFYKKNYNDNILVAPFIERTFIDNNVEHRDLSMCYGYPCCMSDIQCLEVEKNAMEDLRAAARDSGYVTLQIKSNPLISNSLKLFDQTFTGKSVVLDLTQSEEQRQASYRKVHRRDIKNVYKFGMTCNVRPFTLSDVLEFNQIYTSTMKRLEANSVYYFGINYLKHIAQSRNLRFFIVSAHIANELVACSLFSISGEVMQYQLSGTSENKYRGYGSKLIIETGAAFGKEQGCRFLNLGKGLGGKEDNLFQFKAGFSNYRIDNYIYKSVLNETVYNRSISNCSSHGANGFPEYR